MRNGLQPNAVWYACLGGFVGSALGLLTQVQTTTLTDAFESAFSTHEAAETASEPGSGDDASISIEPIAVAIKDIGQPIKASLSVKSGDTLLGLLQRQGVVSVEAHRAVQAMTTAFDPRDIRVGQTIEITMLANSEQNQSELDAFRLAVGPGHDVVVVRNTNDDFVAESLMADTVQETRAYAGSIQSSLYEAAVNQGVPPQVLVEMIRLFSYDVDFQRDIRQNDSFKIMFSQRLTENGLVVENNDIEFAAMTLRGDEYRIYAYEHDDGMVSYYNQDGKGIRKALMRTPINGARLSSSFGRRKHPVLGYTKMHRGVDFAAPRGTPIYAAGDGVIEKRQRWGSFGNYIRIRHGDGFSTAYAHMKNFAKGYSVGSRVRQGAVIGYVGTTGRSTGPHLHYEVLRGGTQVNPLKVRFPASKVLAGADFEKFQNTRKAADRKWLGLTGSPEVALLGGGAATVLE